MAREGKGIISTCQEGKWEPGVVKSLPDCHSMSFMETTLWREVQMYDVGVSTMKKVKDGERSEK